MPTEQARHRLRACGVWLSLLAAPLAAAEQSADAPLALDTVQTTATRSARISRDVGTPVTVVDDEGIRREMTPVVPAALRGRLGAFVQQTTPGQASVIVRGLKGSQVLHLVDGMRLNNAFFRDAPNQYSALIDPFSVARIELVRGPSPSLYGADAMGGVVQVLTREPRFAEDQQQWDARSYVGWNSAEQARLLHASAQTAGTRLAVSAGLSYQDYGDRRTGAGERISPSGYEARAADLKLAYAQSAAADWLFSAQHLEQPDTPRVDELVAGFGQTRPGSSLFQFEPNRRAFYHGRYRARPAAAWLDQLEVHLARQIITDDRRIQATGDPLVALESNESRLDGLTLQLDSTFGGALHLTYGIELYADEIASSRLLRDSRSGVTQPAPGRFPDGSSMDSVAAYLHQEWRIDSAWTVSGGLRYSRFELALIDPASGTPVELQPDDLTGNLGLSYRISPGVSVMANLGRGFRPPNIFDLGAFGPRPGNRFNVANTALAPESLYSVDIGIKAAPARWQLEAFVFYMDYQDRITSVATGELTSDGRTIVRSENAAAAELYGVEAGARYAFGATWQAHALLNYTRGEQRLPGETVSRPADRIPPLNGRIGVDYRPNERLGIDAYLLFAAAQDRLSDRDLDDPRIDPRGTPGWATLHLALNWQMTPRVALDVRLDNLSDRQYREHGSGLDAPGINLGVALDIAF